MSILREHIDMFADDLPYGGRVGFHQIRLHPEEYAEFIKEAFDLNEAPLGVITYRGIPVLSDGSVRRIVDEQSRMSQVGSEDGQQ